MGAKQAAKVAQQVQVCESQIKAHCELWIEACMAQDWVAADYWLMQQVAWKKAKDRLLAGA